MRRWLPWINDAGFNRTDADVQRDAVEVDLLVRQTFSEPAGKSVKSPSTHFLTSSQSITSDHLPNWMYRIPVWLALAVWLIGLRWVTFSRNITGDKLIESGLKET